MTSFNPKWKVHPGETLYEELCERGRSQVDLARTSGWTPKHINLVVNGKARITVAFAVMLEDEFGVSAQFWMNLQSAYDIAEYKGYPVA